MPRFIPMTDYSDTVSQAAVDYRFGVGSAPKLTEEQVQRLLHLREHTRLLARHVLVAVPCSHERDRAIDALDDALSLSARAISRLE